MPVNTKIGGPARYIKSREAICLTNDQARPIYEKVESESKINIETIKQEIEADRWGGNNLDGYKVNPYHKIIMNRIEKDNTIMLEMEQWSILSNIVNCVQCNRHPRNLYDLDIKRRSEKPQEVIQ